MPHSTDGDGKHTLRGQCSYLGSLLTALVEVVGESADDE